MPVRTRRLIQCLLLAVEFNATAASTYLQLVGPPALRFEPPRVEPTQKQSPLPPLPPLEPKSAVPALPADAASRTPSLQPVSENGTAGVTNNLGQLPANSSEAPIELPQTPAAPAAESLPGPIENLTPQMFMKFFTGRPGTNASGSATTIFAPLPFTPPVPVAAPSSSATYQTAPAPKP